MYHLEIDETSNGPIFTREWLQWKRGSYGAPFRFLDFANAESQAIPGETPDDEAQRYEEKLDSPEVLAVNTLGQFAKHPRVSALRKFITGWHLSYLSAENTRGNPEAGPQERLSQTGDNLPNVMQYLKEQHEDVLENILEKLKHRVPRLERVDADILADGRLLLQIKDAPFERPILSRFTSNGTLKMLAYLTLLYNPEPPELIGIEEPENDLHPRLLSELTDECREASELTQLMVTSHSPFFVKGLRPKEAWVLYREADGYTHARRTSDMPRIQEFMDNGAQLCELWTEGYFDVGDPLRP